MSARARSTSTTRMRSQELAATGAGADGRRWTGSPGSRSTTTRTSPARATRCWRGWRERRGVRRRVATDGLAVWRRYMELPRYLRAVTAAMTLARLLGELAEGLGFDRLRRGQRQRRSRRRSPSSWRGSLTAVPPAAAAASRRTPSRRWTGWPLAPSSPSADAVVAVGGGKTIDVAKSACAAGRAAPWSSSRRSSPRTASPRR